MFQENNLNMRQTKTNSEVIKQHGNSKKLMSKRPETPHINLITNNHDHEIQIRSSGILSNKQQKDNLIKNFSAFMKQIIETQNENFLSGDIKVIEFIIAKYLNIEISQVKEIEKLSIKINSDYNLINQFGDHLPILTELKLNHSQIFSIGDIGTSFRNLMILQVNNCGLKDLSGIICFSNLEVFEAQDNVISDLFELEMCSTLIRLNFKNNLIKDEENFSFLESLSELRWLNLNGNPIKENKNYTRLVEEHLGNLECIDVDQDLASMDNLALEECDDVSNTTLKILNQSNSTFSSSLSLFNKTKKNHGDNRLTESLVEFNSISGSDFFGKDNEMSSDDKVINNGNIQNLSERCNSAILSKIQNNDRNKFENSVLNSENDAEENEPENFEDSNIFSNKESTTPKTYSSNSKFNTNNVNKNDLQFNFDIKGLGDSSNYKTLFRGNKSQIERIKDDEEVTEKEMSQRLRPVIVKKEAKKEIQTFRKLIDGDTSQASSFKNTVDRSKPLNPLKLSKIGNVQNKSQAVVVKRNVMNEKSSNKNEDTLLHSVDNNGN